MIDCLPWLALIGFGLNFLLTALVPSWRENGWNRSAFYGWNYFNHPPLGPNPWLQLGFAKRPKPIDQRDFDEKSALLLYWVLAALFLVIGIGGLVLIVHRNIS